jgi:hypothetical protein
MNFKELREKYRSKYPASLVSAAVKIAIDMAGNMTGAYKKIENMKRGLGDDPIVKDALRMANESVEEGTMAIGIKDRDPKERAKAQAQLKVLLKKIGNKKVGSKEGQDFDDKLDYDILSDDELADEFANPKNKNMKVKDLLKKHSKRLNVNFDESVEEGHAVSRAQQAAIAIAKKKKNESVMDSYRQMWESENLEEKKEFKQNDIDKVAKLTDRNEHTKSLIHIAKSMGDKKSLKKLELIDKMHNEYGHMPKGLMDMRNEVYDDLKKDMEKYSNGKDMYNAT